MQWMRRHRRGRPPHPDVLTPAEWRVLDHIRAGRTNAEIAVRTGLSINTVKTHVSSIHAKTGIPEREGLVAWHGQPAPPEARPALTLPLLGAVASGGKVALGGAAGVVFLAALFLVFAFFTDDDPPGFGDGAVDLADAHTPCGMDIAAFNRFYGDPETWECFESAREAVSRRRS